MSVTTTQLRGPGRRDILARIAAWLNRASSLLEAGLDKILHPTMPWLHAALSAALLPTLGWAIVTTLFFLVPQTREVLHGLSEPRLRSIHELNGHVSSTVNHVGMAWYVAAAIVLAVTLWYSARLLLDEAHTKQRLQEAKHHPRHIKFACTSWPRFLGVSALSASAGALIFANYTPGLTRAQALGLALLAVAAPLLMAIASLWWRKHRLLLWTLAWASEVLVITVLVRHTLKPGVVFWCLFASVWPAIFLAFQKWRRDLLEPPSAGAEQQRNLFERMLARMLQPLERWVSTWKPTPARAVLIGLLSLLPLGFLALGRASWIRSFGTAAAVLVFFGAAVLLLAFMQAFVRRVARQIPGLIAAGVILLSILVAVFGKESLGTERPKPPAQLREPAGSAATVALAPKPTTSSGHVYVNAHGGGLRAALFTAETLSLADDATCGAFGESLGALSGVSGGSLGIAVYLLARQELGSGKPIWSEDCSSSSQHSTPLTDAVKQVLIQDHLSAAMARMLAVDAPHIPGNPKRGQALLDSWQSAFARVLPKEDESALGFAMPLGDLNGGLSHPVSVYFNATDADTGHTVWFSNRDGGRIGTHLLAHEASADAVTVGEAVLHSARFPIITPPGSYAVTWANDRKQTLLRLVDGGYTDNSGAMTLSRIPGGQSDERWMINIDGNPQIESKCPHQEDAPPIVTAVRALLQARTAHAALAVQELSPMPSRRIDLSMNLERAYGVRDSNDRERCEEVRRVHVAPLGWYMSYDSAEVLEKSVGAEVKEMCGRLALTCHDPTASSHSRVAAR